MKETAIKPQNETITSMFKAGAHFGYSKSRRHPSMSKYIFGVKQKTEIFDLEKAAEVFESSKEYMEECGKGRKIVLFVSGKNEGRDVIRAGATKVHMPYVAGRWIGGTLTNFSEIKKRIDRMTSLIDKREKGELSKYTKLEQLQIDREIEKLEDTFGGLRNMERLPHALFVVDTRFEHTAVDEAKKIGIPVVALVNSDCDTEDADHICVGNDASIASITFFVDELARAYEAGALKAPTEQSKTEQTKAPKEEAKKD